MGVELDLEAEYCPQLALDITYSVGERFRVPRWKTNPRQLGDVREDGKQLGGAVQDVRDRHVREHLAKQFDQRVSFQSEGRLFGNHLGENSLNDRPVTAVV